MFEIPTPQLGHRICKISADLHIMLHLILAIVISLTLIKPVYLTC